MAQLARRWLAIVSLAIGAALPASYAGAVIVRLPAPSGGESATPGPALTHLAVVAGLSSVYLGDGWLLTAAHVLDTARARKLTDVAIGGRHFALRLDTAKTLQAGGERSDLALVRIDGDPGLPPLAITGVTPAVGTPLVLAGNGPLQESQRGCWNPAGQPVLSPVAGGLCGYAWRKTSDGKTNGIGWGTNEVAFVDQSTAGPRETRTRSFATQFRDEGATPREAQAGVGDSGGPAFIRDGDSFELAGIMIGVAARSTGAALFGDRTFIADLAGYRDEILRTVGRAGAPKPAANSPTRK